MKRPEEACKKKDEIGYGEETEGAEAGYKKAEDGAPTTIFER